MTENVIGTGDSLPDQVNGGITTDAGSLNFNVVANGQSYNGLSNYEVDPQLVGNVNLSDEESGGVQLADDTTGDPQATTGRDMYDYNGAPEEGDVPPVEEPPAAAENVEGTRVTIKEGDTLWALIGQHYGGKYPLEAVYAANNMEPRVVEKDGKKEFVDPIYHVGDEFVLPPEEKLAELTEQYRARVNDLGKTSEARVGAGAERSEVKLIFGDTLYSLGAKKYGTADPPLAAIYEANNMTPTVVEKDGKTVLVAPTYYAGKTYVLPAENEIAELTQKFWARMGQPQEVDPAAEVSPPPAGTGGGYEYSGSPEDAPEEVPSVEPPPVVDGPPTNLPEPNPGNGNPPPGNNRRTRR